MKKIKRRFEIVVTGEDESDVELGFEESVRLIREGNVCGHNSNDTGSFQFEVLFKDPDDVPDRG